MVEACYKGPPPGLNPQPKGKDVSTQHSAPKNYVVDTNVLIENPQSIINLRNGSDNNIYIPYHVLIELNQLKTNPRLRHIIAKVIDQLLEHKDNIRFIRNGSSSSRFTDELVDNYILKEIQSSTDIEDPILVTNDRILRLQASMLDIASEEFRDSKPFESESQLYTGFSDADAPLPNSFTWQDGKPVLHSPKGDKAITYQHDVWNTRPRSVYQNLALELMLNADIDLVSVQGEAGFGKTYLALAASLYQVLEQKRFNRIILLKPTIELGAKMGFLPGDIEEKMQPYVRYIKDLLLKLHSARPANRLFIDPKAEPLRFNPKKFEILPLAYIRGMNIENACVIIDETQNLSRVEIRALLTRMGENVKCICLGDTSQVDNPYLSVANNGLNWVVRKCKGADNYAHLVLKGERSRGPITDLVLKSKL
ncbi:PhoH family protein [Desulfobaculum senezii]